MLAGIKDIFNFILRRITIMQGEAEIILRIFFKQEQCMYLRHHYYGGKSIFLVHLAIAKHLRFLYIENIIGIWNMCFQNSLDIFGNRVYHKF